MPKLYTSRHIPGKGQGMFADRAIKAGVRILADNSLFSIADCNVNDSIGERISLAFNQLSREQQQQFETLHCPDPPTWTPLVSRFLANSFEMGDMAAGIFLEASRVNHSCCPNAFFAWNGTRNQVTIHAVVDIPAGEEITVSYDYQFMPFAVRQDRLRRIYGFECDCAACHLDTESGRLGDLRRQRMEFLHLAIEKCKKDPSEQDNEELKMVLEFIRLAKGERMDGQFLSCMFQRASIRYEANESMALALKFAEMELESDRRLLGEDHPMTKDCVEDLEHLKIARAM